MKVKMLFFVILFLETSISKGAFLENGFRYLSPMDMVLKMDSTFSVFHTFVTEHPDIKSRFSLQVFEECGISNDNDHNEAVSRDKLGLMGGADPLTGRASATNPTVMFMNAWRACVATRINEEFTDWAPKNANEKSISTELKNEYHKRLIERYFSEVTLLNSSDVLSIEQNLWANLTLDSQRLLIENSINLTVGSMDVLLSYGFFENREAVFGIVNSVVIPKQDNVTVLLAVESILKYFMTRDEFLSY